MTRHHTLVDLTLGAVVVLVACALAWSLYTHRGAAKVLAQSAVCGNGSVDAGEECDGSMGSKYENGRYYYCSGCRWMQQTIDDPVPTNNNYCCLSNGRTARCAVLRTGEICEPNPLEQDVKLFSAEPNNQRACEEQRVSKVCNPVTTSSSSSFAASCGNNVLETSNHEECDWGGNNSDTLPNRCRRNCKFPTCGDGKVDDNFSDPVSGVAIAEECDNIQYVIDDETYPAVSDGAWAFNAHTYCGSDCRVKTTTTNPLFFMFPSAAIETSVYFVRNIFDWNSIFFPLSSLGF